MLATRRPLSYRGDRFWPLPLEISKSQAHLLISLLDGPISTLVCPLRRPPRSHIHVSTYATTDDADGLTPFITRLSDWRRLEWIRNMSCPQANKPVSSGLLDSDSALWCLEFSSFRNVTAVINRYSDPWPVSTGDPFIAMKAITTYQGRICTYVSNPQTVQWYQTG